MRLATIEWEGQEQTALLTEQGAIPLATINEQIGTDWDTDLFSMLQKGRLDAFQAWYVNAEADVLNQLTVLPVGGLKYGALYRRPGKIIGVGMNYLEKAIELSGRPPEDEPVIFLKPDTSLIGPGESIVLPAGAGQIAAEAELAIVIGQTCRNVEEAEALNFVAGYTASLDMTAKDIHARNPRFMQRAKSFDTFVSLGASLTTPDEYADLPELAVETVYNGATVHRNTVSRMIFSPAYLIAFLSRVMTLNPGDIILTGTPGSVIVEHGDEVECRIAGIVTLRNPVEHNLT